MLYPATLSILPPTDVADLWHKDYENMRTNMIYGESPSWQELTDCLAELQKKIRDLNILPKYKTLMSE